jgi:hypothetical protein
MRSLEHIKDALSDNMSLESLLDRIGLQQKRSTAQMIVPALGIFAAGAVVGGLLGLLFAPRSGRAFRAQIRNKVDQVRNRVEDELENSDMSHS